MRSPVPTITDDQLDDIDSLRRSHDAYALLMARRAIQHLLDVHDGKVKPCARAIESIRAIVRSEA